MCACTHLRGCVQRSLRPLDKGAEQKGGRACQVAREADRDDLSTQPLIRIRSQKHHILAHAEGCSSQHYVVLRTQLVSETTALSYAPSPLLLCPQSPSFSAD